MAKTNPKIDAYLAAADRWQAEMRKLRTILNDCGLDEELKWGKPCYAFEGHNVAVVQPMSQYCALLFMKGALLKDPGRHLAKTGPNAEVGRQLRFNRTREIADQESVLRDFVRQAIEAEKAGLKIKTNPVSEMKLPEEFQTRLTADPKLKAAFSALTPGRQRAYLFFISGAKQSKTREARVEKCAPRILREKGLDDD
ncbi:MAG TPA: YdeI/OmpD-associated family protein [Opitutaceae bacterium]|jgi:uncharacterized protein YdeI (YjbR/CyaY-like superfamily)